MPSGARQIFTERLNRLLRKCESAGFPWRYRKADMLFFTTYLTCHN